VRIVSCGRCGERIDRGACGQAFSIVTVKDDRENDPEKYHQSRFYLCDNCTSEMGIWVTSKLLEMV